MVSGTGMMEERLIKRLMTSIKCEYCGQKYELRNVDILGHKEGLWVLRVSCSNCHTQYIMAAVVKEDKRPETVAELTETEPGEFYDIMVEVDDVLDMHNFLKDFDGDFSGLFGREES